jgi:hypothetical protein
VIGEAAVVLRRLSRGAGDEHLFHPEEADRSCTRLSELLRVTGILEVESLLYYSRRVESAPQSKAALRALLQSQ